MQYDVLRCIGTYSKFVFYKTKLKVRKKVDFNFCFKAKGFASAPACSSLKEEEKAVETFIKTHYAKAKKQTIQKFKFPQGLYIPNKFFNKILNKLLFPL